MSFTKGHKKLGGRQAGTQNKRTLMVKAIADKVQVDPLEVIMRFAAGDWAGLGYKEEHYFYETNSGAIKMEFVITPEMRLSAAKDAATYLYARKKEADIEEEDAIDITPEDKKKLLEKAQKEIEKLRQEVEKSTHQGSPEDPTSGEKKT